MTTLAAAQSKLTIYRSWSVELPRKRTPHCPSDEARNVYETAVIPTCLGAGQNYTVIQVTGNKRDDRFTFYSCVYDVLRALTLSRNE